MPKEFMLFVRNRMDHQANFTDDTHKQFLEACRVYIGRLQKDGKLKSAQPIVREGKLLSGRDGKWKEAPFNEGAEVIVGYYHVFADSLEDAVSIAKGNPEFVFTTTARVEIRPIKMKEETTGFVYPKE